MAEEGDIEAFLEHHGVKGMHWGVSKSRVSNAGSKVRSGASKTIKFVKEHPQETVAAAVVGNAVYQHRGEIAGTAVIAGKVGSYLVKQAFTKDSPTSQYAAIGRQVVQGFVVNG